MDITKLIGFSKEKLARKSIFIIIMIAVFCTAICGVTIHANINHAVAMEQQARCNIPEHVHQDSCYDEDVIICGQEAHTHDGNCYLVLLKDNDINDVLTLVGEDNEKSLESVISSTVSAALNFNDNINTPENSENLDEKSLSELNDTISSNDSLPPLVLNENINRATVTAAADDDKKGLNESNGLVTASVGDTPSADNYDANVYAYIDGKWTCIGTIPFERVRISNSSNRYNSTIPTNDLLELVNTSLGTEYNYNSFDIAVSTSQNSGYSTNNIGINRTTTMIGYRQLSNDASKTKHIRLIPNNGKANSMAFAFYSVKFVYPEGNTETRYVYSGNSISMPHGDYIWSDGTNEYEEGHTVRITSSKTFTAERIETGPITYVNINYNINFPTISGVTVSMKPTLAGTSVATIRDEYTEGSIVTIRNVSEQSVKGNLNNNSTGQTRAIQFRGWKVEGTDIIIQPNTNLVWEEVVQYADRNDLDLIGVWEYSAKQTASFFIRFDSVAVDTDGNVTGQDSNKYTKELFSSYVGGVDTSLSVSALQDRYHIADVTPDNSYTADQEIRALYGEKTDGVWLYQIPHDDYIFKQLEQYATTGYLSVDGETVKVEDLNDQKYAIRWYVFKCQDDAWHIDGKLVKKVGLIHMHKTFAGNKELIEKAKDGFSIDAYNKDKGEHYTLDMTNFDSYDASKNSYSWKIEDVEYGEEWQFTENVNKQIEQDDTTYHVYSSYSILDVTGDQSRVEEGTSFSVSGVTYAPDEGVDESLKTEFTNIYNKSNSIVIKKQDATTGNPLGGAEFKMVQNGEVLKFNYNDSTSIYEYDMVNGTETVLSNNLSGYFEISIEDFSYDSGPIVLKEITAPEGYTPIGDIEIGYVDDTEEVGILSGNSDMTKYTNGVLIIGNSTDEASVTVKKQWDCPESEWQDVYIQLFANSKLVTSVISGVKHEAILNRDNNWTYTWDNLPLYVNGEKIQWSIKEVRIGNEDCKSDGTFVNWLASYELPVKSTDSKGNENTLLTVTNTTKRVMLRLTKTDYNKLKQLSGATFTLEAVDSSGEVLPSEVSKTATTGDLGTLIFDNLKCGVRYRLAETAAPEGYHKIEDYIYLTINEDGSVAVEDDSYAGPGSTAYNIFVINSEAVPLPEAGGKGNSMFYVTGLLLLIAAAVIYIRNLRKRRWEHRT